jgi:hypothetical protein
MRLNQLEKTPSPWPRTATADPTSSAARTSTITSVRFDMGLNVLLAELDADSIEGGLNDG